MGHLTTRPVFVFGFAFGVLPMVLVWGAFGALATSEGSHADEGMAMGRMMEAKARFISEREGFVARYTRPDGCVEPPIEAEERQEGMDSMGSMDEPDSASEDSEHQSDAMEGMEQPGMSEMEGMEDEHTEDRPVVYLQALQFGYLPGKLCLKTGVAYEFKMMATDVIHGASIQLGQGSKMVRLPSGAEVEQVVTFTEPGEYMLYCSTYCGLGHQFMKGQIIVEPGPRDMEARATTATGLR